MEEKKYAEIILFSLPSISTSPPLPLSLSAQDYHWWWRSFSLSGSASYYVMGYAIIYYYTKVYSHVTVT